MWWAVKALDLCCFWSLERFFYLPPLENIFFPLGNSLSEPCGQVRLLIFVTHLFPSQLGLVIWPGLAIHSASSVCTVTVPGIGMWQREDQSPALEFHTVWEEELFMLGLMCLGATSGHQTHPSLRMHLHLERKAEPAAWERAWHVAWASGLSCPFIFVIIFHDGAQQT